MKCWACGHSESRHGDVEPRRCDFCDVHPLLTSSRCGGFQPEPPRGPDLLFGPIQIVETFGGEVVLWVIDGVATTPQAAIPPIAREVEAHLSTRR